MKRPALLFALLCGGCVLATVLFGVLTLRRPGRGPVAMSHAAPAGVLPSAPRSHKAPPAQKTPPELPQNAVTSTTASAVSVKSPLPAPAKKPERKLLFFRANALGENYGKLSVAALDALDQPHYAPALSCDRVYFSGGKGICLAADRGMFTKYSAVMFDKDLKPGWSIPLNGVPSRARVSHSGRLGAVTIFLAGHSYVSLNFSTQTLILNTADGHVLADLDTFAVTRDGAPIQSADFNFWGVTFARDENQFYATLWSKGKTHLVKCNLRGRSAEVIYDDVECPSLSPDNTRIAYKKRVESFRVAWRIHVLDLRTMTAAPAGETHSVDDQVEWLDNNHLLYSRSENETGSSASTDIWKAPAAGGGTPELLLKGAFSPAIASSDLPL